MMLPDLGDGVGGPAALFGVCLFTGMGLPFPEEIPLLVAGWEIRQGALAWVPAMGAAYVALFLRDVAAFVLGRLVRGGSRIRLVRGFADSRRGRWIQGIVDRFGATVIWVARFAPGLRVPLVIAAGMSATSWRLMLMIEFPGLLLTIPFTLWLGWRYGVGAVEVLESWLNHGPWIAGVVVLGVVGAMSVRRLTRS